MERDLEMQQQQVENNGEQERGDNFSLFHAVMVEMGIPSQQAKRALYLTHAHSMEQALRIIYAHHEEVLEEDYNQQHTHLKHFVHLQKEEKAEEIRRLSQIAAEKAATELKLDSHDSPENGKYCGICMEHVPVSEIHQIAYCQHEYCKECLGHFFSVLVHEGRVQNITCPEGECNNTLSVSEINRILVTRTQDEQLIPKYTRFLRLSQLRRNPLCRWCPECQVPVIAAKPCKRFKCPECNQWLCFHCSQPEHVELPCDEALDKQFRLWARDRDVQSCPQCRWSIERVDGCNHMVCAACCFEFCWLCKAKFSSTHYEWWNFWGCPSLQFADAADNVHPSTLRGFSLRVCAIVFAVVLGFFTLMGVFLRSIFMAVSSFPFLYQWCTRGTNDNDSANNNNSADNNMMNL